MDHLKKSLTPLLLWSIGVGNVISGMYFGWNLGLEKGGTFGMAIATLIVILMYVCFSYSYAELACAIPKAGGGFDYATRAFGKNIGFLTGLAQVFLYNFSLPAIALGIATNLHLAFPSLSVFPTAVIVYFIFTGINIIGVKTAASFEMVITIIAVIGIVIFCAATLPSFSYRQFSKNTSSVDFNGIFAAIPFAIWFFLGIEGLANVAEESKNPAKDMSLGFSSSIITLIILCVFTFIASIGLEGWEKIVYNSQNELSDSPLPLAISLIYGSGNFIYQVILFIGILGLVASFHGGLLAGGRATFEFGRTGFAPKYLGQINSKFKTPANALLMNMVMGIIIISTGKTGQIITIAVFGLLFLYISSMASLIKLRNSEPNLKRPFKVLFYPLMPLMALIICIICFFAMAFFYQSLVLIFLIGLLIGFILFRIFYKS